MSREEKQAIYDKLVQAHPEAERKGDTIPYTSLNGHMYSMITKGDDVALRLPEAERAPFIQKHKTKLVEQYGIVQKEWVVVPDSLLKNPAGLKKYFDMSYQYVSTKKPKPTKKK
jgi:hypothetical protein